MMIKMHSGKHISCHPAKTVHPAAVHHMEVFVKERLAQEKIHHEGRVALVFNAAEVSSASNYESYNE